LGKEGKKKEKTKRNEGMIKSNQLPDSVQSILPEIAIGTHLKGLLSKGRHKQNG